MASIVFVFIILSALPDFIQSLLYTILSVVQTDTTERSREREFFGIMHRFEFTISKYTEYTLAADGLQADFAAACKNPIR
jgi:hypothetical protein